VLFSVCNVCSHRYETEYEEAKRKTKEALHPLKLSLAEVDDQVLFFTLLLKQPFHLVLVLVLLW
jgi:hypothetical protein